MSRIIVLSINISGHGQDIVATNLCASVDESACNCIKYTMLIIQYTTTALAKV